MRKAAVNLSALTKTGVDFYLRDMSKREFVELNNEVAEEWRRTKH